MEVSVQGCQGGGSRGAARRWGDKSRVTLILRCLPLAFRMQDGASGAFEIPDADEEGEEPYIEMVCVRISGRRPGRQPHSVGCNACSCSWLTRLRRWQHKQPC